MQECETAVTVDVSVVALRHGFRLDHTVFEVVEFQASSNAALFWEVEAALEPPTLSILIAVLLRAAHVSLATANEPV